MINPDKPLYINYYPPVRMEDIEEERANGRSEYRIPLSDGTQLVAKGYSVDSSLKALKIYGRFIECIEEPNSKPYLRVSPFVDASDRQMVQQDLSRLWAKDSVTFKFMDYYRYTATYSPSSSEPCDIVSAGKGALHPGELFLGLQDGSILVASGHCFKIDEKQEQLVVKVYGHYINKEENLDGTMIYNLVPILEPDEAIDLYPQLTASWSNAKFMIVQYDKSILTPLVEFENLQE